MLIAFLIFEIQHKFFIDIHFFLIKNVIHVSMNEQVVLDDIGDDCCPREALEL